MSITISKQPKRLAGIGLFKNPLESEVVFILLEQPHARIGPVENLVN